jgi:O-antigen ligase
MMPERARAALESGRSIAAVSTASMIPISTSGLAITLGILALLSLLTAKQADWSTTMRSAAAATPALLFLLMVIGTLWSPHPLGPGGLSHYVKLLVIPLMMTARFSRQEALYMGYAFTASCLIILILSLTSLAWPTGPWGWFKSPGVPVKDNAVQSTCFALCAFGLGLLAVNRFSDGCIKSALAAAILALLFFADVFLIYLSKTGMLIAAALLGLFLARTAGWRRSLALAIPLAFMALAATLLSSEAQLRVVQISKDIRSLSGEDLNADPTVSTASRIDFWRKALELIGEAPVLGHGTGSTKSLYQRLELEKPSPYGEAVPDPHNQFLAIAIQVGLVGAALLLAMWVSHFLLFAGFGVPQMLGQAIVLQNVLGSLFNSQLSQITQGTLYCLAVGLLGGLVMRASEEGKERATKSGTTSSKMKARSC